MGTKERRATEIKQMQDLILRTAMQLFLEKGFGNVSLRRIAEKIQYSPATIYRYYRDKDEILFALHSLGFEKLFKRQQSIRSVRDPWERLREHGRHYVGFAIENPEFYDLMFIMRGPAKTIEMKDKWEAGLRSYELLRNDIQECIEKEYLQKTDVDVATFAFWSLAHGVVSLLIRNRCIMFPGEQMPHIIEGALDFIMGSIVRSTS